MKANKFYKIALYIRVSTEEQAANPEGSIKSQEQRLRQYVDLKNMEVPFGEVVQVFTDRAKSGKDTKRPALQHLLKCIKSSEVNLVMVTELSRLSRSIRDFSDIWELMKAHKCEFLCLREQFDTTTAAGEMVLYTIANISQFERKQLSERVSANFQARAKRGLYNGGPIPFGYKTNKDKPGHLVIIDEEAEIVREIFRTYLRENTLSETAKSLNNRGYQLSKLGHGGGNNRVRLGYFTVDNVQKILRNPTYTGLRKYTENNETKTTPGCWEPIISKSLFERVQLTLEDHNTRRLKFEIGRRYPYLFAGMVWCGKCGDRMGGKSAHGNGGKIPYYEHGWAVKRQAALNKKVFHCEPMRVQARILEPLVWDEIEKILTQTSFAERLLFEAKMTHQKQDGVTEVDKLRFKLRAIEDQVTALAEHLTKIPAGLSPLPIFKQMEKLEHVKSQHESELSMLTSSEHYIEEPASLKDYARFVSQLKAFLSTTSSPREKTKIAQSLIHRVEVFPEKLKLHFKVGSSAMQSISFDDAERIGSNRLTNGDPWKT